ncbi:hypothetical protein H0H93_008382 [Arthromyces matolae]|nr:hypothetical protein H0H93_008382 [Arthromyces matolae]
MPPRHGKKLVEAMDDGFKHNQHALDALNKEEYPSERDTVPGPSQGPAAPVYTDSMSAPPQSSRKPQTYGAHPAVDMLASFSLPILQVLHEANLYPFVSMTAARQILGPPGADNSHATTSDPARAKRKPSAKAIDAVAVEGSKDEPSGSAPKRRRLSDDARTNALDELAELEGAVKKLQTSVAKDLKHIAHLVASLSAQLNEAD